MDTAENRVLAALKQYAAERADNLIIVDVRMGLSYTGVRLNNGSAGVAMTFRKDLSGGCIIRDTPLVGSQAGELIEYADSADLLERTVAIATINAVINSRVDNVIDGDVLEVLELKRDDTVGMVGFFGPLVPKIRKTVQTLHIFEKLDEKAPGLLPEEKAFEMLPACTVAIITSTTLINRTFEKLVISAQNCRKIILTGASTPMAPPVFKGYGIEMLSGIVPTDVNALLQIISEGGGMRSFKRYINKVNVFC